MKRAILILMILFLAVGVAYAGGSREEEPEELLVLVPEGPARPDIPSLLRNEEDFGLVLAAYDDLIAATEPIIESLIYNGLEANEVPLERLRVITEWWRDYISTLKIEAESPSVRTSEIDEFLGGLIRKDEQFQRHLDEINRIIELENEAAS
jgi:hypothetical protein